jgi:hypothetical protein
MAHTLESFAVECPRLLKAEPGPEGRRKGAMLLQDVLLDSDFVEQHVGASLDQRRVLYEDPELGFAILAHRYEGASDSRPHDHVPSWAIYGQARGETEMTSWQLVEPATEERPGKVRRVGQVTLRPGMAVVYNEGDLHSPRRDASTWLIRIEGMNMDGVRRFAYESIEEQSAV